MKKKSEKILFYIILCLGLVVLANYVCGMMLQKIGKQELAARQQNLVSLPNFKNNPDEIKQIFEDYARSTKEYTPYLVWKRKPFQSKTLTIDSTGFRIQPLFQSKSTKNNGNVYFFGNSTTWGYGVDDNHTISALWHQLNPDYEVHNVSETGYTSRQNLETLLNLLTEGKKINVAIFYVGHNDVLNYNRKNPLHGVQNEAGYKKKIDNPESIWERIFYGKIVMLIRKLGKKDFKEEYENNETACRSTQIQMISQESIKTWEVAKTLVEKQGGKFILIIQPNAFVGKPNTTHLGYELDELYSIGFDKEFKCVYPIFQNYCKQNASWAYDFTNIFDGPDYYYMDAGHVSANGNQKVAAKIDSILKVK